jgi:hypothetical protein
MRSAIDMGKIIGMSLSLSLSLMLVACSAVYADADQNAISDFERKAQSLGESISADDSAESERCRELGSEVEQLAGKPQRRYAARQDYLLECQREQIPSPEPYTIESGF